MYVPKRSETFVPKRFHMATGNPRPGGFGPTWITGFLGDLELMLDGVLKREEVTFTAREIQNLLPKRWDVVSKTYANLRGFCHGLTEPWHEP